MKQNTVTTRQIDHELVKKNITHMNFLEFICEYYVKRDIGGNVIELTARDRLRIKDSMLNIDTFKKIINIKCSDIISIIGISDFAYLYKNIYQYKKDSDVMHKIDSILSGKF